MPNAELDRLAFLRRFRSANPLLTYLSNRVGHADRERSSLLSSLAMIARVLAAVLAGQVFYLIQAYRDGDLVSTALSVIGAVLGIVAVSAIVMATTSRHCVAFLTLDQVRNWWEIHVHSIRADTSGNADMARLSDDELAALCFNLDQVCTSIETLNTGRHRLVRCSRLSTIATTLVLAAVIVLQHIDDWGIRHERQAGSVSASDPKQAQQLSRPIESTGEPDAPACDWH
ncbi:MAG: hypothetical protein R3B68_12985 [Phycisphaerales bacterium]